MRDSSGAPHKVIHPDLTPARLYAIGRLIVRFRSAKLKRRFSPDNNWNIGCDCFAWVCYGIREAAKNAYRSWLYVPVRESELDFLFLIGGRNGVPAKIYREDAPDQPQRTARVSEFESQAIQTAFPFAPPSNTMRFAVATDAKGRVVTVQFHSVDSDGTVTYQWPISIDGPAVLGFDDLREPGVQLPEPPVDLLKEEQEEDEKGYQQGE